MLVRTDRMESIMYTAFCNLCGRVFFDRLPASADNKRDMHIIHHHSKELSVVPARVIPSDSVVVLLESLAEQERVYGSYNEDQELEPVC